MEVGQKMTEQQSYYRNVNYLSLTKKDFRQDFRFLGSRGFKCVALNLL